MHQSTTKALSLPRLGLSAAVAACLSSLLIGCGKPDSAPQSTNQSASSQALTCGKVTVANMNWQSAEVLAHIDAFILDKGYGCQVELVPGDTMPTLTSMMEKGEPDIAPEAWINAIRDPLDAAVKEGRLHYAARALQDGGIEGWWIPKYLADAQPQIKTIDDALKHPELFLSAEHKGKGAVHNCPSGWNCQITTGNAFKAWGAAEKGFVLLDTGSAAGLDGSIAKAYERKAGWLGYYWAPTSILGKYQMVKLDAGVPHDEAAWKSCNSKVDCQNPQKSDWARAEVFTVVTDRFNKSSGLAKEYINQRAWSNETVNALLAWMSANQASGEVGARHFLKTQPTIWKAWVSPEIAAKVETALAE